MPSSNALVDATVSGRAAAQRSLQQAALLGRITAAVAATVRTSESSTRATPSLTIEARASAPRREAMKPIARRPAHVVSMRRSAGLGEGRPTRLGDVADRDLGRRILQGAAVRNGGRPRVRRVLLDC